MLSIRHRFPSVTTLAGIWRRFAEPMNVRTASVVPLIALPRTSFLGLSGDAVCADSRTPPASETAATCRNCLRFKRMFNLGVNIISPDRVPVGARTTVCPLAAISSGLSSSSRSSRR